MTTSTTDAEAIARIIDPNAFRGAFLSTQPSLSKDRARAKATAILSYLASRREAQEPVAYAYYHDGQRDDVDHPIVSRIRNPTLRDKPWKEVALYTAPPAPAGDLGATYTIEHDGFTGTVIGSYTTREGKEGVVLQQVGTKVVHVYGRKWLKTTETAPAGALLNGGRE